MPISNRVKGLRQTSPDSRLSRPEVRSLFMYFVWKHCCNVARYPAPGSCFRFCLSNSPGFFLSGCFLYVRRFIYLSILFFFSSIALFRAFVVWRFGANFVRFDFDGGQTNLACLRSRDFCLFRSTVVRTIRIFRLFIFVFIRFVVVFFSACYRYRCISNAIVNYSM